MSQCAVSTTTYSDELINIVSVLSTRLKKYRDQNTNASRTYRSKNREKVNAISKKYYDTHKEDPEWLSQKREKQKIYQQRRRFLKSLETLGR